MKKIYWIELETIFVNFRTSSFNIIKSHRFLSSFSYSTWVSNFFIFRGKKKLNFLFSYSSLFRFHFFLRFYPFSDQTGKTCQRTFKFHTLRKKLWSLKHKVALFFLSSRLKSFLLIRWWKFSDRFFQFGLKMDKNEEKSEN